MDVSVRHKNTGTTLRIIPDIPLLLVDSKEIYISDVKEATLISLIFDKSPAILTYTDIHTSLLKRYNVSASPYSDSDLYIRKKKLAVSKLLRDETGYSDVILNIRGSGYRLNETWTKVNNQSIDILIKNLKILLINVIEMEESISIINKDCVMMLSLEEFSDKIDKLMIEYNQIMKSILSKIHTSDVEFKYLSIYGKLSEIGSYVSMSRRGSNISEKTWRKLFRSELTSLFNKLVDDLLLP